MSEPVFESLTVTNWRQFSELSIRFHPQLTVITGANGAGKTSILNLLSQHFGWSIPFLSTPTRDESGMKRYLIGAWDIFGKLVKLKSENTQIQVGTISYSNGASTTITLPNNGNVSCSPQLSSRQNVPGLFIPSHRVVSNYQQIQAIPTSPYKSEDAVNLYVNEHRTRWQGGHTGHSPTYRIKEMLISFAVFGEGNSHVKPNREYAEIFRGFNDSLRKVLPDSLGFLEISIQIPDVVVETKTGSFLIDAASGGISALIDIAWQVYMFSRTREKCTILLDEPENHLHPKMQRSILKSLTEAFPKVQFVVASHSPFVVGSVEQSNVYVLTYNEVDRVRSDLLDTVNRAGTANEILREVLGLETTMPIWVEKKLESIIDRYQMLDPSREMLSDLRGEMRQLGLGEFYPDAVSRVFGDRQ